MKKEYGKSLRKLFDDLIIEVANEYKPFKPTESSFAGQKVYCSNKDEGPWRFIILSPSPTGADEFTVEIGWSRLQRFSDLKMRPSFVKPADAIKKEQEYLCRLPVLSMGKDYWWPVGEQLSLLKTDPLKAAIEGARKIPDEEALKTVTQVLRLVKKDLVEYGLPFLAKL